MRFGGGTNSQLALMLYIPELCPVSVVYSVVYFRGQVVCTPVQLHLFTGSTESLTNFESRHKVSHSDCNTCTINGQHPGAKLPNSKELSPRRSLPDTVIILIDR